MADAKWQFWKFGPWPKCIRPKLFQAKVFLRAKVGIRPRYHWGRSIPWAKMCLRPKYDWSQSGLGAKLGASQLDDAHQLHLSPVCSENFRRACIWYMKLLTVGFWCQTMHEKFLRRFDTIFGLKMMVKSCLEKIILKFNYGLQSCCCPVQNNLPRKAELAWQISRYLWRPPWNFKIIFLDHFSPLF